MTKLDLLYVIHAQEANKDAAYGAYDQDIDRLSRKPPKIAQRKYFQLKDAHKNHTNVLCCKTEARKALIIALEKATTEEVLCITETERAVNVLKAFSSKYSGTHNGSSSAASSSCNAVSLGKKADGDEAAGLEIITWKCWSDRQFSIRV